MRWCLSRIRGLVDGSAHKCLHSREDRVWLAYESLRVDAVDVLAALQRGVEPLGEAEVAALLARFAGPFLEGLDLERQPVFGAWLTAQRRRFVDAQVALLRRAAARSDADVAIRAFESWVQLSPHSVEAHAGLLGALAGAGRLKEGEAQLAGSTRLFDAEGLDVRPLREAWQRAREPRPDAAGVAVEVPAHGRLSFQPAPVVPVNATVPLGRGRASIAVMPFSDGAAAHAGAGLGRALAYDIVVRLAKLRTMFVIGQGSTLALHQRGIGDADAARMLEVDYLVTGGVFMDAGGLRVEVQLEEPRTGRILWAETIAEPAGNALALLDELGNRIVASIASEVETEERNRAILRAPDGLDAWQAHHRGLWFAYRFNREDNRRALHCFETAIRLDPTFARAHAGLSFVHFQDAFQGWERRDAAVERAYVAASQALLADDRDPAAHWAMGRALWIGGSDRALPELQQAVDLSPNFAQGHYTLAFVHSQSGDPETAILAADHARRLSPFDPMLFAMLASRALALARSGRVEEAAGWAVQAASRPNAHAHIRAIAALTLVLAGSPEEARTQLAQLRAVAPAYGIEDFMRAFRLDEAAGELYRRAGALAGLD